MWQTTVLLSCNVTGSPKMISMLYPTDCCEALFDLLIILFNSKFAGYFSYSNAVLRIRIYYYADPGSKICSYGSGYTNIFSTKSFKITIKNHYKFFKSYKRILTFDLPVLHSHNELKHFLAFFVRIREDLFNGDPQNCGNFYIKNLLTSIYIRLEGFFIFVEF